jgi:hypothetical protein
MGNFCRAKQRQQIQGSLCAFVVICCLNRFRKQNLKLTNSLFQVISFWSYYPKVLNIVRCENMERLGGQAGKWRKKKKQLQERFQMSFHW